VNLTLETRHRGSAGGISERTSSAPRAHGAPILGFINVAHPASGDEPHDSEAAAEAGRQKELAGPALRKRVRRRGTDARFHLQRESISVGDEAPEILVTIGAFAIEQPAHKLNEQRRKSLRNFSIGAIGKPETALGRSLIRKADFPGRRGLTAVPAQSSYHSETEIGELQHAGFVEHDVLRLRLPWQMPAHARTSRRRNLLGIGENLVRRKGVAHGCSDRM